MGCICPGNPEFPAPAMRKPRRPWQRPPSQPCRLVRSPFRCSPALPGPGTWNLQRKVPPTLAEPAQAATKKIAKKHFGIFPSRAFPRRQQKSPAGRPKKGGLKNQFQSPFRHPWRGGGGRFGMPPAPLRATVMPLSCHCHTLGGGVPSAFDTTASICTSACRGSSDTPTTLRAGMPPGKKAV